MPTDGLEELTQDAVPEACRTCRTECTTSTLPNPEGTPGVPVKDWLLGVYDTSVASKLN